LPVGAQQRRYLNISSVPRGYHGLDDRFNFAGNQGNEEAAGTERSSMNARRQNVVGRGMNPTFHCHWKWALEFFFTPTY